MIQTAPPEVEGFKIVRELGRGGMGAVFLAEEEGSERLVALKILSSKADDGLIARFELEGDIGQQLSHPDIVTTFAAGQAEDFAWIAMEYLDGFELTEAIHDPELGFEDRVKIITRVAAALEHAHSQGILHRDVKPSNIFMTREGDVRLLDFGIARKQDTKLTQTGHVVGTPRYMSPEQIYGSELDGRADVFSLGVVAYELFAGVRPWNAENPSALVISICTKPPTSLKSVASRERYGLSQVKLDELHAVIHKAIEPDAGDRYESALHFAQALELLLCGDAETKERALPSVEELGGRHIEWAKARAARLQLQGPLQQRGLLEALEEAPDRSGVVWGVAISFFAVGLAVACWMAFRG